MFKFLSFKKAFGSIFWIILWSAPFIGVAWICLHFFVPIAHHEMFDFINSTGQTIPTLFTVAEHKILFPYLFLRPIVHFLPSLAFPFEKGFWFNQMLIICWLPTSAFMASLLAWQLPVSKNARRWVIFTLILLICSFAQWENISSNGTNFIFSTTAFLGGVTALMHLKQKSGITCAAVCAFIATFSIGSGLVAWIALFPLVLMKSTSRKNMFIMGSFWMMLFACTSIFYLKGIDVSAHPGSMLRGAHASIVLYFLTLLGMPIIPSIPKAAMAGCIVMLCALWSFFKAHRKGMLKQAMPWLCLFLFVSLTAALITFGRSSLGLHYALSSRYASITLYALVALVPLLVLITASRMVVFIGVMTALASNIISIHMGYGIMAGRTNTFLHARACLATYTYAPASCLGEIYFGKGGFARKGAAIMDSLGALHTFNVPDTATIKAMNNPSLGTIEQAYPSGKGLTTFTGWAMLPECQKAEHIILTSSSGSLPLAHTIALYYRKDIAIHTGCKTPSVWQIQLSADELVPAFGTVDAWNYDEKTSTLWNIGRIKL